MPKKTYIEGKFKEILLEEFGYKKQDQYWGYYSNLTQGVQIDISEFVYTNQLRPGATWHMATATRMNQLSRQYNAALTRELEQSRLYYQDMYAVQEQRALTDETQ